MNRPREIQVKPSFLVRVALFAIAAVALLVGAGCATMNRENYVHDRAGQIVYERPMPEVWAGTLQMLTEDGFSGRGAEGSYVHVTEWKESEGGSLSTRTYTRYLVEGKQLGQNRSAIRFTKATRNAGASSAGMGNADPNTHAGMAQVGPPTQSNSRLSAQNMGQNSGEGIGKASLASGTRDLAMEWRLLQRLDPQKARAIEAEALKKYP